MAELDAEDEDEEEAEAEDELCLSDFLSAAAVLGVECKKASTKRHVRLKRSSASLKRRDVLSLFRFHAANRPRVEAADLSSESASAQNDKTNQHNDYAAAHKRREG